MKYKLVIEFKSEHSDENLWRSEINSLIESKMQEVQDFAEKMTGQHCIYKGFNSKDNEYVDLTVRVI